MVKLKRIISWVGCFVITIQLISAPLVAYADLIDGTIYGFQTMWDWILGNSDEPYGGWTPAGWADAVFSANKEQKYYTTPTESVEDRYGNVTNYYRGGDTTTTKIIDSYNKTFNTIHNTTNTTNNYEANVKLSDFLNTYATYNNSYTYQNDFKSWYYDYDTNNFNYNDFSSVSTTNNNLYYNEDNRQYYISIDNSTDEYYLIDVQYSPTFVTVNYNYYNTTNNYGDVGDVTNIYYFELTDGRNSSTLSASEVAGLDLGYDVTNYVLVPDDPNTLSLQHFDGNYTDSSSYGRSFYSENRSTNYVDSGAFGQAVKLPSGSAAGVTIPGLSDYDSLSFDFRIYYADIADLGIYIGDTNIFQEVPTLRKWVGKDVYSGGIIVQIPNNDRHGFFLGQLTCPVPPVTGHQLIAALRVRAGNRRNQNTILPNTVGGLHHGLVILDFEGMPLKWVQLRQRNFLYLLQLGILAAFLGGKQIIVWSQLYFFRAAFQVLSPPWSDSYSPRPPCH